MDIKMSIASSRSSPSLLLFLKNMGVAQYFDYVLGSDNVTRHKPEPEPVLMTLAHYGVEPSEALVVGDMPVDIEMAHNAGVRAVGVSYGNATRRELIAANADAVIDHISELIDVIEGQ
jgi:phosphoglycolate phosphatase